MRWFFELLLNTDGPCYMRSFYLRVWVYAIGNGTFFLECIPPLVIILTLNYCFFANSIGGNDWVYIYNDNFYEESSPKTRTLTCKQTHELRTTGGPRYMREIGTKILGSHKMNWNKKTKDAYKLGHMFLKNSQFSITHTQIRR